MKDPPLNDFPLLKLWARIRRANATRGTRRLYNTRYCGSINKVSTQFCSLAQISWIAVVGRRSFVVGQPKENRARDAEIR